MLSKDIHPVYLSKYRRWCLVLAAIEILLLCALVGAIKVYSPAQMTAPAGIPSLIIGVVCGGFLFAGLRSRCLKYSRSIRDAKVVPLVCELRKIGLLIHDYRVEIASPCEREKLAETGAQYSGVYVMPQTRSQRKMFPSTHQAVSLYIDPNTGLPAAVETGRGLMPVVRDVEGSPVISGETEDAVRKVFRLVRSLIFASGISVLTAMVLCLIVFARDFLFIAAISQDFLEFGNTGPADYAHRERLLVKMSQEADRYLPLGDDRRSVIRIGLLLALAYQHKIEAAYEQCRKIVAEAKAHGEDTDAWLATAYDWCAWAHFKADDFAGAEREAIRAVAVLDTPVGRSYRCRGFTLFGPVRSSPVWNIPHDFGYCLAHKCFFSARNGNYERAKDAAARALEAQVVLTSESGTLASTAELVANSLKLLGDYESAREYFAKAGQFHENSRNTRLAESMMVQTGICFYEEGRYADAEAEFKRALAIDGSDPAALCWSAITDATCGRPARARRRLDSAWLIAKSGVRAVQDWDIALLYFAEGMVLKSEGKLAQSARCLEAALQIRESIFKDRFDDYELSVYVEVLANINRDLVRSERAAELYDRAARMRSNMPILLSRAFENRAVMLRRIGEVAEAQELAERACTLKSHAKYYHGR